MSVEDYVAFGILNSAIGCTDEECVSSSLEEYVAGRWPVFWVIVR
jgi:hypothetical protein